MATPEIDGETQFYRKRVGPRDRVDDHLARRARVELFRRSGKKPVAERSDERDLSPDRQEFERRVLTRRRSEIEFPITISDAKCVENRFLVKFLRLLSICEIPVRLLVKVGN